MTGWKRHFSRALSAAPGRLHLAAHSHHLWPDVTYDAHMRAWDDAARFADDKWDCAAGALFSEARAWVARRLGLSGDGQTVVFGPNTHGLLVRLLSCLPADRPLRVLTTDAEFHSFRRQLGRLEEAGRAAVRRIPVEPFDGAGGRLAAAAAAGAPDGAPWDLVWFSQVFFDSGHALTDGEAAAIAHAGPDPGGFVVIDGYHGFMARPADLSAVQGRAFYLAGGYKYAMAGEGACFMHCPPGYGARPIDTGWFAVRDALALAQGGVTPYPPDDDGTRFAGATADPTPIHRFVAVQRWLEAEGMTVEALHAHARGLQERFLDRLGGAWLVGALIPPRGAASRGNFLTFRTPRAGRIRDLLREAGVVVDHRVDRLRVGFGPYLDEADVDAAAERFRGTISDP